MVVVNPKKILRDANRGNYCIGAFNINNMEVLQGIVEAAVEEHSPVIIQTSQGAIEYGGMDMLAAMVHTIAGGADIPIAFHLDHGTNVPLVKEAIKSGFYTSVMIDGSKHPFKENIKITREIVRLAHKKGIHVEAELGAIPGKEDQVDVKDKDAFMTDPSQALEFVEKTGCDTLAVSIGTKHGINKFTGKAKLDFKRLETIKKAVKIPLVLHGASSIPRNLVDIAENYGADLSKARGVSDGQLRKAIEHGVNKINTDSDLRIAFTGAVDRYMTKNPDNMDPRKYLRAGRDAVKKIVKKKIMLFGSHNKA